MDGDPPRFIGRGMTHLPSHIDLVDTSSNDKYLEDVSPCQFTEPSLARQGLEGPLWDLLQEPFVPRHRV